MNVNKLLSGNNGKWLLKAAIAAGCLWILFRITRRAKQNFDIYTTPTTGATLTNLQAAALAQKIAGAWGWINDDETAVYNAFYAIQNYQDLILVMRNYSYKNQTLVESITKYMNQSEINKINKILAGKGIDFRF